MLITVASGLVGCGSGGCGAAGGVWRKVNVVVFAVFLLELVGHLGLLLLGHAAELDRVLGHAEREALLQAAKLAAVAVEAVDDARFVARAHVLHVGRVAAAEEALFGKNSVFTL